MAQVSVMVAQFPGGSSTHPDPADWVRRTSIEAEGDDRFRRWSGEEVARASMLTNGRVRFDRHGSRLLHWSMSDTPIDMVRNLCVRDARRLGVDYLVMIDNDVRPDLLLDLDPTAKPFWGSSWEKVFAEHLSTPCIIAAPYCGPPPHENVFVFQWADKQTNDPNGRQSLEQFSREEGAIRGGIQEVAALPTGLMIIDMRVFDAIEPRKQAGESRPRHGFFYYEMDADHAEKESTEDVTFTRDASLAGIPCYCNWDAWCGHWKSKLVTKPMPPRIDAVRANLRAALQRPPVGVQLVTVKAPAVAKDAFAATDSAK